MAQQPDNQPTKQAVRIVDVGPRDGLQNEAGRVPTAGKAGLVRALIAAGLPEIELTSFVSPRWIPQLGDAAELLEMLAGDLPEHVTFSALVPNMQGMDRLLEANEKATKATGRRAIDKVCLFTAASETFSQKNTNASIAGTLERFMPVANAARENGLQLRGYVSCAFGCPFEGAIGVDAVVHVAQRLSSELGVHELSIADTIGQATPGGVTDRIGALGHIDSSTMNLHLHDTLGRAAECVRAGLRAGVRSFDGAIGGLGGCPYASTPGKRAPGNIATSTLVQVVEDQGFATGVDHAGLDAARTLASELVSRARAEATA
ncbi:MAG: hydroxymethylglutaryl-CoA lyase [Phycisphaerales bacterium JB060]